MMEDLGRCQRLEYSDTKLVPGSPKCRVLILCQVTRNPLGDDGLCDAHRDAIRRRDQ